MSYHKTKFSIRIYNVKKLIDILVLKNNVPNKIDGHYYAAENPFIIPESELKKVSTYEEVDENGLFYQILYLKGQNNNAYKIIGNIVKYNPLYSKLNPNQLVVPIEEIIYLDFNMVDFKNNKYRSYIEAIFNSGFSIRVQGSTIDKYRFLPFDKSASMGRHKRISFLSEIGYTYRGILIDNFYKTLAERSHLGLDVVTDGVNLAKRYAYRGLLMSGGFKVESYYLKKQGIELNEETVLIVPDQIGKVIKASYYTQEVSSNQPSQKEGDIHLYARFNEKPLHVEQVDKDGVNLNDGFGLISERFARAIDSVLGQKRKHTSFQIRLPYVKGLVHIVDFKSFLKEHKNENGEIEVRHFDGQLNEITSIFSEEQLDKVELVITESMFKCIKELELFLKVKSDEISDVIKYYWEQFHKYNHSLFILSFDKKEEEITKLNFQFLSTSGLNIEAFSKLFHYSEEQYNLLLSDTDTRIKHFLTSYDGYDEDKDEEFVNTDYADLEEQLLSFNPKVLINEPYYVSRLEKEADSLAKNIGTGALFIKGQDRYLSGDILSFLYWMSGKKMPEKYAISYSREDSFIAPRIESYGVKDKQRCAVLRNPHLSRNEDLTLCCYLPEEDSERNKYGLNQLTGVCMIDPTDSSLPADTVGGADYDGDHVKIILDDSFTESLFDHKDDPLVIGDSHKALLKNQSQENNRINQLRTNLSTFDNDVGMISNLALKEALKAYAIKTDEKPEAIIEHNDRVRLLGIMTGLETDSAKTGIKPYYQELDVKIKKDGGISVGGSHKDVSRYFIEFKNLLFDENDENRLKGLYGKYYDFLFKQNKNLAGFSEEFYQKFGRSPNPIELLIPSFFCFKDEKKTIKTFSQNKNFIPELPVDDEKHLNEDISNHISNWVKAYKKLKSELIYSAKSKKNFGFGTQTESEKNIAQYYQQNPESYDSIQRLISNLIELSINDEARFNGLYEEFVLSPLNMSYLFATAEKNKEYFYSVLTNNVVDDEIINILCDENSLIIDVLKEARYLRKKQNDDSLKLNEEEFIKSKYFSFFSEKESIEEKFDELKNELENSKKNMLFDIESSFNNEIKLSIKNSKNKNKNYKKYVFDYFQRFLNNESVYFSKNSLKSQAEESANYCIKQLDFMFGISSVDNVERDDIHKKLALDPLLKAISENYEKYSAERIIKSIYGSIELTSEMIKDVNSFRYHLIKNQSPYYIELKKESLSCNEDSKTFILRYTKSKLEEAFSNLEDETAKKREVIRYLRALQSKIDPSQSFLFAAYLPELIDIVKEGLAND